MAGARNSSSIRRISSIFTFSRHTSSSASGGRGFNVAIVLIADRKISVRQG
jgi:hypothetical protein